MASTSFNSIYANIEYRQMIRLNGSSTYMIVKVFHWKTTKIFHLSPQSRLYQTVQTREKIRNLAGNPVVRFGGLNWVRKITA